VTVRPSKSILLINGNPDPAPGRLCSALADAYAEGAEAGRHRVRRLDVGNLDFPLIQSEADFRRSPLLGLREIQDAVRSADHLVIIYPLWLGGPPAKLKGLLEQVFRYGVALSPPGEPARRLLRGRTARVVVTMGMPSVIFWWVFGAFGLRSLTRGLLWISGIAPIRTMTLGRVQAASPAARKAWLAKMRKLGLIAR